jgi:hypothetical protein
VHEGQYALHQNPLTFAMQYDYSPKLGIDAARLAIARAASKSFDEELAISRARWGARASIVEHLKSDVAGHEIGDADFPTAGTSGAMAEFGQVVDGLDLIGRSRPVNVPAGVPFLGAVTAPTANWFAGGAAVPMSRALLSRDTMQPMQVGCLIVLTEDLLRASDARAEGLVLQMMTRSARIASDAAFISSSNGGDDATPASITNAATPISSSGDLADDAEAAIAAFGGSLATACWAMSPQLAAQAGLRANAGGAGADLGALGGTLAGLPCYTTEGMTHDSTGGELVLFDRSAVAVCDEGYSIARSRHASLEFADNPTGNSTVPTTMQRKVVSLFQAGAQALLMVRRINFVLASPTAVVVVSGCSYAAV